MQRKWIWRKLTSPATAVSGRWARPMALLGRSSSSAPRWRAGLHRPGTRDGPACRGRGTDGRAGLAPAEDLQRWQPDERRRPSAVGNCSSVASRRTSRLGNNVGLSGRRNRSLIRLEAWSYWPSGRANARTCRHTPQRCTVGLSSRRACAHLSNCISCVSRRHTLTPPARTENPHYYYSLLRH